MATLTVEGKQFDMNDLSDEAKSFANAVSFCDNKISQLESELAMARMARNGYVQQLVNALPKEEPKKAAPKKATPRKSTASKTTTAKRATAKKASTTSASTTTTRKRAASKTKTAEASAE